MPQRLALIAVTAAALCALGCEDRTTPIDAATLGDSPSPESDAPGLDAPGLDSAIDPGGTATMITAAAGGIARSADGLFEIYVSPGALSEDTTITITRVAPDALPAEVVAASPQTAVYSVEPDGLTFGGDGAFGHFHLDGIPASLVGATGYRGMTAWARQADRPGLERHPESQTVLDLSNDTCDVGFRLAHLSLQFATSSLMLVEVQGDLGIETRRVHAPWITDGVVGLVSARVTDGTFTRTLGGVQLSATAESPIVADFPEAIPAVELAPLDRFGPPAPVRLLRELGSGMAGTDPRSLTGPAMSFNCTEVGSAAITAGLRGTWVLDGGPSYAEGVSIRQTIDCILPRVARARLSETSECHREGPALVCDAARATGEVSMGSAETTSTVLAPGIVLQITPADAPAASGPPEITASSGGTTMRAVRRADGTYACTYEPSDALMFGATVEWAAGTENVMMPAPPEIMPAPMLGPIDGLSTDLLFDFDVEELQRGLDRAALDLSISMLGLTPEGALISLRVAVEELAALPGGGTGAPGPYAAAVTLAAMHMGITEAELLALLDTATIDVEAMTDFLIDPSIELIASRRLEFDLDDLLASCPDGQTRCTDRCVNTATDPMNCGGCGLMPPELCDGADNDCDGLIDERCPNGVVVPSSPRSFSDTFGVADGGNSIGAACPTFTVMVGFCGNIDTTTGSIRSLRGQCASLSLETIRTSSPYTFEIRTTPLACAATGGGASGGTPFSHTCAPGEVVDTVSGMAGSDIGRFAFRCARLDVVNMDGLWHIVRGTTAMSSTFGTGAGSAFGWTVENDATTGFPGALFGYDLTFAVPGTVHSLRASGAAPYLRVP